MKLIYLSGPYRSSFGEHGVWSNIMAAREAAIDVWKMIAVPICPHLNTMLMGGAIHSNVELEVKLFLEGDCEIISRCDAVLMLPGWERSKGSNIERDFALKKDIPVFYDQLAMSKWLLIEACAKAA